MPASLVHIQGAVVIQVCLKAQCLGFTGPGDAQLIGVVLNHPGTILELAVCMHPSLDNAIGREVSGAGALVLLFTTMLGGVGKALEQLVRAKLSMGKDQVRRKQGQYQQ